MGLTGGTRAHLDPASFYFTTNDENLTLKQRWVLGVLFGVIVMCGVGLFRGVPPVQAAHNVERSPAFETVPCSTFKIQSGEFECGYVSVPELHALPDGKQIKLGVAILPSTNDTPTQDAFVMSQGGPGGSTIDLFSQFLRARLVPRGARTAP